MYVQFTSCVYGEGVGVLEARILFMFDMLKQDPRYDMSSS